MYKPDRNFIKRLKELDSKLGCEFNGIAQRFNITYQRSTGEAVPILRVKTETGGFRFPDQRELNALYESDTQRVSMKDRLAKSSKYMYDFREKKRREASENMKDMTIDSRLQLRNAVGRLNTGKSNSTFRRILPKSNGKVFK